MKSYGLSIFAFLFLVIGLVAPASAADAKQQAKRSDEVLGKFKELDLLNQILPLLMTKEQMRKILPDIEKARDVVRKTQEEEYKTLIKLEETLDKLLKAGYENGRVATDEELKPIYTSLAKMRKARQVLADVNAGTVLAKLKETLDKGQLAAARNALSPSALDPSVDVAKLDDDGKLLFYVRWILLDPLTYDILLKLSK